MRNKSFVGASVECTKLKGCTIYLESYVSVREQEFDEANVIYSCAEETTKYIKSLFN